MYSSGIRCHIFTLVMHAPLGVKNIKIWYIFTTHCFEQCGTRSGRICKRDA